MYSIRDEDAGLLQEFLVKERKDWSLELRRLLNRLRLVPLAGRECIVTVEPEAKYRLAKLGRHRGDPVQFLDDRIFTSTKEAEFEILKMRWQRVTGSPYPSGRN